MTFHLLVNLVNKCFPVAVFPCGAYDDGMPKTMSMLKVSRMSRYDFGTTEIKIRQTTLSERKQQCFCFGQFILAVTFGFVFHILRNKFILQYLGKLKSCQLLHFSPKGSCSFFFCFHAENGELRIIIIYLPLLHFPVKHFFFEFGTQQVTVSGVQI